MLLVVIGAGVSAACFVANLVVTARRNESSRRLGRLTYLFAGLTLAGNTARLLLADAQDTTVVWANVIAFACIMVSFYRSEKNPV